MYQDVQVWFGSRQRDSMINCIQQGRLNKFNCILITNFDALIIIYS